MSAVPKQKDLIGYFVKSSHQFDKLLRKSPGQENKSYSKWGESADVALKDSMNNCGRNVPRFNLMSRKRKLEGVTRNNSFGFSNIKSDTKLHEFQKCKRNRKSKDGKSSARGEDEELANGSCDEGVMFVNGDTDSEVFPVKVDVINNVEPRGNASTVAAEFQHKAGCRGRKKNKPRQTKKNIALKSFSENTSCKNLTDENSPAKDLSNDCKLTALVELSYEEYLTQQVHPEASNWPENPDLDVGKSQSSDLIQITGAEENTMPITNYFTKLKVNNSETNFFNVLPKRVKIVADVHPEPTVVHQCGFGSDNLGKLPVCSVPKLKKVSNGTDSCHLDKLSMIASDIDDIVVLGSEVIKLNSDGPVKDRKHKIAILGSHLACPGGHKGCEFQEKSGDENLIKIKSTQSTLRFSSGELQMAKGPEELTETHSLFSFAAPEILSEEEFLEETRKSQRNLAKGCPPRKGTSLSGAVRLKSRKTKQTDVMRRATNQMSSKDDCQPGANSVTVVGNMDPDKKKKFQRRGWQKRKNGIQLEIKDSRKLHKNKAKISKAMRHVDKTKIKGVRKKERAAVNVGISSIRQSLRLKEKRNSINNKQKTSLRDIGKVGKRKLTTTRSRLMNSAKKMKPKSNKMAGQDLAPIFLKKSAGRKSSTHKIKQPQVDLDVLKLRRAFLMSGLPDEVKRQLAVSTDISLCSDYLVFPTVSHVQGSEKPTDGSLDVWNLPEVTLNFKNIEPATPVVPVWRQADTLTSCKEVLAEKAVNQNFRGHCELSQQTIQLLLQEISEENPSYPVQQMYKSLVARKQEARQEFAAVHVSRNQPIDGIAEKPVDVEIIEESVKRNLKIKRKSRKKESAISKKSTLHVSSSKDEQKKAFKQEKVQGCDLLWTEKYQPRHSMEVLGNCGSVKKLKSWLLEWKNRTDKEARKMKLLLQQAKKSKCSDDSDKWWMDGSNDFAVSENSENEDDQLCNTTLISGPHGVGKTATVYALAQELGYQVFEVNASMCRNGKRILTQLQEATQSHQVSKDKLELENTSGKTLATSCQMQIPFNSLFGNQSSEASDGGMETAQREAPIIMPDVDDEHCATRNRKTKKGALQNLKKKATKRSFPITLFGRLGHSPREQANPGGSNCGSKGLNLSSISLILFDEVDVVLEEDRGFWAAIQHFMSLTKRPIILTATDPNFSSKFDGDFESLNFRTPATSTIRSHLWVISLVENVRIDAGSVLDLVKLNCNDLRSCLLNLQFWVESGGGVHQEFLPISRTCVAHDTRDRVACSKDDSSQMAQSPMDNGCSVGNDLVKMRKRDHPSEVSSTPPNGKEKSFADPCVTHFFCMESCFGLSPSTLKQYKEGMSCFQKIEDGCPSFTEAARVQKCCQQFGIHLSYQLHHSCLPLLKCTILQKAAKHLPVVKSETNFEGEALESKPVFQPLKFLSELKEDGGSTGIDIGTEIKQARESCSLKSRKSGQSHQLPLELKSEEITKRRSCSSKILCSMARFYDSCSASDSMLLATPCRYACGNCSSSSWLCYDFNGDGTYSRQVCEVQHDISADVELRSFLQSQEEIALALRAEAVEGWQEDITIPSEIKGTEFINRTPCDRKQFVRQKALENIMHNLPLHVQCQRRSLYTDYLPVLRDISRMEWLRQKAKIKRRFFHYFNSINFPLKESTLNVLASDFT